VNNLGFYGDELRREEQLLQEGRAIRLRENALSPSGSFTTPGLAVGLLF